MAETTRRADVAWEGNLLQGKGIFSAASGALRDLPVSWPARTEAPGGKTSPEELIAAAHASCYAMAFSHTLATNGFTPERLNVTAVVTFADKPGGGKMISKSELTVRGKVGGVSDQKAFEEWAAKGEQGCPVSNALRNNVAITVRATLEK
ncbi:MAG: OsmC family peroxiredoxin [Actinobacteria bacterium]|nr:OsmC family peroxiredoxin [Actinomycetota bacterium]